MRRLSIVGTYATEVGRLNRSASDLSVEAIRGALADAGLRPDDVDGVVAVPSLSNPHFMQAHYIATKAGFFGRECVEGRKRRGGSGLTLRTIDTGGAGPISSLLTAGAFIRQGFGDVIVCVAGDAVLSLNNKEFIKRADGAVAGGNLPSPAIPSGYDRVAQWQIEHVRNVTREQLAMVPVIMSHMAARHPEAMCKAPLTLQEVLESRPIGKVTTLLECARRADGAAAIVIAAADTYHQPQHHHQNTSGGASGRKPKWLTPHIVSVGEASGPLFPAEEIHPSHFSVEQAARRAYDSASLTSRDVDFFSLYDCFPICFVRALEACHVVPKGEAGAFIQAVHDRLVARGVAGIEDMFPINTHGGLSAYGAPWETPAAYGVIEAVKQLTNSAGDRQVQRATSSTRDASAFSTTHGVATVAQQLPQRALCYGNGGVFASSAVAILANLETPPPPAAA